MVTVAEVFAAVKFPEYPEQRVKDVLALLQSGEILTQLESDKFALLKWHDYYALLRNHDNQILGWIVLTPTVEKMNGVDLKMVYILPEYRNGVALSVLLFGVKHFLNKPLIIDNAVSTQGQMVLRAMIKRPQHFKVWYVERDTGDKRPYVDGMLQPYDEDHIIVVEQHSKKGVLMTEHNLPGGYVHSYTESFFEKDHEELMK